MTEFIARAKRKDNKEWIKGELHVNCNAPHIHQGKQSYYIDKNTVCWQCPETPYFEHDVLKVYEKSTEGDGEVYIVEVYFNFGAFLVDVPYGESECLSVAELNDLDFEVELLGNTIDNPELLTTNSN